MENQTKSGNGEFVLFDIKSDFMLRYNKYIIFLLPAISLLLWTISLVQAKGETMGEYGIFSILGITYYAAVFLLLASIFYTLFGPKQEMGRHLTYALLFQSFLLMVFLLFTPSLIEGFARSPHSWSKYGYVDYIVRNGHISQSVTHYHNWPIPFIFCAEMVLITSIDPITFPLVFPLILDIILFFIIVLFFSKLFKDIRIRFVGISIFYLILWENQFHFAPQFFGFVIFVLILYLVIFYLKKENITMLAIMGIMIMLLIMTHLLTAFVACLFLGLIILYQIIGIKPKAQNRSDKRDGMEKTSYEKLFHKGSWDMKFRSLQVNKRKIMFFIAIAIGGIIIWYLFARDWVAYANWSIDLDMIGLLTSAYIDKLRTGSDAHGTLVLIRMVFTAIIVSLALIGAKLAYDKDKAVTMYIIIFSAIVPVFLFYYGVEIVQRAFLFSALPLGVLISLGLGHKKFLVLVLALSFMFVPLHALSMYGNEKVDYTPPSQISGARFVFDNVPPDGIISGGNPVDRSQYIEKYGRVDFEDMDLYYDSGYDLYLVYSSSDEYFSLWYHGDDAYIDSLKSEINSDNYIKIFDSPDCQIYKYKYS